MGLSRIQFFPCRRRHDPAILDQECDPLPAADAGRRNAVAAVAAIQFARERQRKANAGRAKRMADRDRAAIDVELVFVDVELARTGHHLCAKGLVDFEAIDIGELEARVSEQRPDRRSRPDTHDMRRNAGRDAGDEAVRSAFFPCAWRSQRTPPAPRPRRRRCRGIAAGLHAAEGRRYLGERLDRRRPHMGVAGNVLGLAANFDAAGIEAVHRKCLGFHRDDFAGEKSAILRSNRAVETARGVAIDLRPRDLVLPREIFGGIAHGGVGGRIEQRLPQKVLELHLPHPKAAAMGIGGDRIATHRTRCRRRARDRPDQARPCRRPASAPRCQCRTRVARDAPALRLERPE